MKERNTTLELAKGILIILVVLGHAIQYSGNGNWEDSQLFFDDIVFRAIYSFHTKIIYAVLVLTAIFTMFLYILWDNDTKRESTHCWASARLACSAIYIYTAELMLNFHTRAHNVTNFASQQLGPVSFSDSGCSSKNRPWINSVPSFIWCRLIFLFRQGYIVAKFP